MASNNPLNPFRDHLVSVNITDGSSESSRERTAVVPDQSVNANTQETSSILEAADISSDPPPAYTPTADAYRGEAPLEFGPNRPFQAAPSPMQAPIMNVPSIPNTASEPSPIPLAPPPRHPSTVARPPNISPSLTGTSSAHSPVSAFMQEGRHRVPSVGSMLDQGPSYSPPPGPPPPSNRMQNRPLSPPNSSPGGRVPNDGRPTTVPTPGHPLLKDGKLLVYPPGYTCSKCHNTGYKSYDPSHPCRNCWKKYARNYAGALAYAPSGSETGSSSSHPGNFQKPLPIFTPPHAGISRPHSTSGYPGDAYRLSHSISPLPPGVYTFPAPHVLSGTPYGHGPMPPMPPMPPLQPTSPSLPINQGPPPFPTPLVVQPGDPRLGGRLCWRCGGRGSVLSSSLLGMISMDSELCSVCQGIGRTNY